MKQSLNEKKTAVDYFHNSHWLSQYQAKVSLKARRRMYLKWRSLALPLAGDTVLDVGTTPNLQRIDSNCLIPWLDEDGFIVSLYSPEQISSLQEKFPFSKIIDPSPTSLDPHGDNEFSTSLPLESRSIDWVLASAVIEHVGGFQRKIEFLSECARVARKGLMLTTPNCFHWLEFHTKLPIIHWLPKSWHRKILKVWGLKLWALESHLDLISAKDFYLISSKSLEIEYDWQIGKIQTLGMTSNFILIATRK